MMIEIRDDVIWFNQLESEPALLRRLSALEEDEQITLRVDDIEGRWARMKTGKDGRPTHGIKPVGAMAIVWRRLQARRGEAVRIEWPDAAGNGYLEMLEETLDEWRSAEDEAAFGDLRPL